MGAVGGVVHPEDVDAAVGVDVGVGRLEVGGVGGRVEGGDAVCTWRGRRRGCHHRRWRRRCGGCWRDRHGDRRRHRRLRGQGRAREVAGRRDGVDRRGRRRRGRGAAALARSRRGLAATAAAGREQARHGRCREGESSSAHLFPFRLAVSRRCGFRLEPHRRPVATAYCRPSGGSVTGEAARSDLARRRRRLRPGRHHGVTDRGRRRPSSSRRTAQGHRTERT